MEERVNRILKWAKGEKCGPFTIELFPTFRCNQSCVFCPREHIKKDETPETLDEAQFIRIINEAAKLGTRQIDLIGGGEPLACSTTPKLIRLIKQHGIFGYLNTNGTLFSEDLIKDMVEKEWDYVKFSLHGPDKSTHDSITNNSGSFDRVKLALKKFKYWKKKLKKDKPIIEIGPVLCKKNYNKLNDLIKLAHKYNIQHLLIQPLIKYPFIKKDLSLDKEEITCLKEKKDELIKLAKKYGINTNLEQILNINIIERSNNTIPILKNAPKIDKRLDFHCYEPWLHLTIWPNGTVASCSFPGMPFRGKWEGSLEKTWNSEYFEYIRNKVKNKETFEYCSRCITNVVLDTLKLKNAIADELKKWKIEQVKL
jgi:MoaA/NifB/PqqE/SkfB family radical SAM enzyme